MPSRFHGKNPISKNVLITQHKVSQIGIPKNTRIGVFFLHFAGFQRAATCPNRPPAYLIRASVAIIYHANLCFTQQIKARVVRNQA